MRKLDEIKFQELLESLKRHAEGDCYIDNDDIRVLQRLYSRYLAYKKGVIRLKKLSKKYENLHSEEQYKLIQIRQLMQKIVYEYDWLNERFMRDDFWQMYGAPLQDISWIYDELRGILDGGD